MLELPHMEDIWKANRARDDFAMLVVGREETDDSVTEFKHKRNYSFPIAADPEGAAYSLYAKELIPRTYLIMRDGTICFASTGFQEDALAALKAELAKQLGASP